MNDITPGQPARHKREGWTMFVEEIIGSGELATAHGWQASGEWSDVSADDDEEPVECSVADLEPIRPAAATPKQELT